MKIKKVILATAFFLSSLCAGSLAASANESYTIQCNAKEEIPQMRMTGIGKIEAEPDKAVISLSIMIQEVKLQKAYERNRDKVNEIMAILAENNIEQKDVKTTQFSIDPVFEETGLFNKVQRPVSYVVTQGVTANVLKLDSVGKILNSIAEIESVNVQGVDFVSTKIAELKREAVKKAAEAARQKALDIVVAAGGKLGKILGIEESTSEMPPRIPTTRARGSFAKAQAFDSFLAEEAQSPTVHVSAGTLTIEAFCTITYEVERMGQ